MTSNVWHHAAATYDGTTWSLYLDGLPEARCWSATGPIRQHPARRPRFRDQSTGTRPGIFRRAGRGPRMELRPDTFPGKQRNGLRHRRRSGIGRAMEPRMKAAGSSHRTPPERSLTARCRTARSRVAGTNLAANTARVAVDDSGTLDEDSSLPVAVVTNDTGQRG